MKLMRQKGQILLILLGILFFGSSATAIGVLLTGKTLSQIKKEVSVAVSDKERIKKLDAVLDGWAKFIEEQDKKIGVLRKEMFHLLQQREAPTERMEQVFNKIDDLNQESIAMIVNSRFALKEHLSVDEWRRIFIKEEKGAGSAEQSPASK